ncbi:MAG: SDR family oxidoreductase [Deltaproteobacteria bacterium]|uniref:SDR family NAD(P)-dependent oxidoreductase n=1 Tax=Desulfobacula sp. TaxID=2593537 RepID=UPI0019BC0B54|nr:SDR family oxidoreductase [Candidatus Desulfobacula maris]MBL6992938.1 SDR family oxidoreductase [Desulfobacula sp.]
MEGNRRLERKVAIITGAASGIGAATAHRFAKEGAYLILTDVNEEALKKVKDQITGAGGRVVTKRIDVGKEDEVKDLVDLTLNEYSKVDILVNNAGVMGDLAGIDAQDGDVWHHVYDVNVLGAVYGTKYVAGIMQKQKSGAIVNISSVAGIRSGAGGNAYSASKAAVINFTQTSACDLGEYNIRVNCVCPGLIETGMTQMVFDYAREKGKEKKLGSRCELRRYGRPEEIAGVILFLSSDDASYMTGQALAVDGGNTASLNLPGMKF